LGYAYAVNYLRVADNYKKDFVYEHKDEIDAEDLALIQNIEQAN
jgi:hypothetical protein